jgi:hypothetical protein
MKKFLSTLFLTGLFCVQQAHAQQTPDAQTTAPQKTIEVFPASLSFSLDRGATSKQTITVANHTAKPVQFNLEFTDWYRDTIGKHQYLEPGTSKHSCSKWVTFDKSFVEVKPGSSETITVTLSVPDTDDAISQMRWSMLLVKTVSEKKIPTGKAMLTTAVTMTMAVGIHVYQTPPNIQNKSVKMLDFTELAGQKKYRIIGKNEGGMQINGKFSIELAHAETGERTVLGPLDAPLFPDQIRYMDFDVPENLPKGKYTAVALIDAGDDEVPIEAVQAEITIK